MKQYLEMLQKLIVFKEVNVNRKGLLKVIVGFSLVIH